MVIRKHIFIAVSLIVLISALIFCVQNYNKYAYVLTKGNLPFVHMLFDQDLANDSWDPMHIASDYWDEHNTNGRIYTDNLIAQNIRFQYPPVTLFIPQFVDKLNISNNVFYAACTYLFILITALSLFKIVQCSMVGHTQDRLPWKEQLYLFLGLLALTVLYFPILQGAVFGNIQIWLNALFAISLICMIKKKYLWAGVLIGLAATVKPQFGLLLVWAIFRKNWQFMTGFLLAFGLITLGGVIAFSIENHIDYLNALSYLSQHGESYHHNQSLNGLLNRMFGVASPDLYNNLSLIYLYQPFPPYNPWVYFPTLISSMLIIGLCLLVKRPATQEVILVDYCLMSLGLTLASPITWIYHYGLLLPISVVLLTLFCLKLKETDATKILFRVFAVCFLITSLSIPFVEYVYHTYLNVVQSYYYFAALGMFLVLYLLRRMMSDAKQQIIKAGA